MSDSPAMADLAYPRPDIGWNDIQAAAQRLAPYAHRTPVLTCQSLDDWVGTRVYLKCENLQKTGAFKFRGAVNAVSQLTAEQLQAGVVTHSSGNHAAALAAAARLFGTQAHIVMPHNANEVKKTAVRAYGGRITECQPTLADREAVADQVAAETGAQLVPPFNDARIIAGQGTCAAELFQRLPHLDAIAAPIGGGGLISGTSIAARHQQHPVTVWGVEPLGADDAWQSKQQGQLVPQTAPETLCDGLRTGLGALTWPFIREDVDAVLRASDDETVEAMRFLWQRTKVIVEPSSAVVIAAVRKFLADQPPAERPQHLGVIVSGGNVDLDALPWT